MKMGMTQFIIITLAVWRITHLIQAEDGPWDVVVRLRRLLGNGVLGHLMDCFYCLSLWIALPFGCLFGTTVPDMLLLWAAFSGSAIILERVSST
jgi:hypothetical protein